MLALDDVEPADAGADVHPDAGGILLGDLQARHLDGFFAGGKRQVNEARHLLDLFFLDEL